MRGIVGIVLALLVYTDPDITDIAFKDRQFFLMANTAVLTVVIQGATYQPMLQVQGFVCFYRHAGDCSQSCCYIWFLHSFMPSQQLLFYISSIP